MNQCVKIIFSTLLLCSSAFADDGFTPSEVKLNAQIQDQIKALQAQQQQQLEDMNTKIQAQMQKLESDLETEIQTANTQIQGQLKTLQDQIAQLKH